MALGIIGAMEVEVAHLKKVMDTDFTLERAGMVFHSGKLQGADVVVVQCGIGKINAAMCAQILVDEFKVDAIMNTGVAGSLDNRIEIGDLVVSTDAVHHDVDVCELGYAIGEIPDLGARFFEADENLRKAVISAATDGNVDVNVFEGRVASGDQFIADPSRKKFIKETFGALCCEMEGATIAHVSYSNKVPFVIVRAISDKADGSKKTQYPVFEAKAAQHCAEIVEGVARIYSENKQGFIGCVCWRRC